MHKSKTALSLVALLALSAWLAGCSTPKVTETPTPSSNVAVAPEASSGSGTAATNTAEMEGNMYVTGLPIVKEKESFSFLIDTDGNPDEMELYKRFEEETNVHVNWQAYSYEIAAEKKNLMYSSGDYPDVVGGWLTGDSDVTRYGMRDGVFIPIDEKIAKYAPRITYCLDNFPNGRTAMTAPDGHIYSLGIMAPQGKTRLGMFINKTWLEKAGLANPTTTDEFYTVLKAFKDGDMNGNGKADEIPLSVLAAQLPQLFGWFGLPDTGMHIQMQGDKPVYTANTEGYKEAVKYFAKLYGEGLLDTEVFTQDTAQYRAKGKGTDVLFGSYADFYGTGIVGVERYQAEYEPMPVLSSPVTSTPTWAQGDPWIFRTQALISSKAKNPDTIIRWFDYVFGEDNSVQTSKGPYGMLFNRKEDGSFETIAPPPGETIDTMRNRLSVNSMPYCIMPDISDKMPPTTEGEIKKESEAMYEPYLVNPPLPQYWLTSEETESVATITTDLGKYVSDMLASWVTGQSNIDADWDAYLKQLDTLGLQKYMEVYTTAVQRSL